MTSPSKKPITEYLYGIHPVGEALSAGRRVFFEISYAGSPPKPALMSIIEKAKQLQIPVKQSKPAELQRQTKSDGHQNMVAKVSPYPVCRLSDLALKPGSIENAFIVLLDSVVDPHNLGAIARSALCFGADALIIPKDRSAPPSAAASKASAGALEHICLIQVTNLVQAIKYLQDRHFWIVGLDHSSKQHLADFDFKGSIGMVIGGEGRGLRPLVQKNCDHLVSIPQNGPVNSLNASVAGSIAMYEACRQRLALYSL